MVYAYCRNATLSLSKSSYLVTIVFLTLTDNSNDDHYVGIMSVLYAALFVILKIETENNFVLILQSRISCTNKQLRNNYYVNEIL